MKADIDLALQLLPTQFLDTLYMVGLSTTFGLLIGLPLGIILTVTSSGHVKQSLTIYGILEVIVNITRSFPFAILMVALIPFTRAIAGTSLGTTAAIVPLSIAAAPSIARLIESALKEVDRNIIEAAVVMGATTANIIVLLMRESLPSIISAITITVINLIGYSAMAGLVGGGGLGQVAVQYGYLRFNTFIMFTTVILLVILVQFIQWIGSFSANMLLKKRGKIVNE